MVLNSFFDVLIIYLCIMMYSNKISVVTILPYSFSLLSLLPSSLQPQLYSSPSILHTRTFLSDTSTTHYKYKSGAVICLCYIISVKLMIILLCYYSREKGRLLADKLEQIHRKPPPSPHAILSSTVSIVKLDF